ncbi:hypothetical protein Sste5346_009453 [Sporothrix stenoceras]|uniref:Major facilitator superfamily (MFS) profile domain-containing protein n=1 Tax=Sporothrix stenoceras TaxID=5173 RepID=A0ABR3YKA9_9PEZI
MAETGGYVDDKYDGPLSIEHRAYLIDRHGTADLKPVPCMDDNDPLNWPKAKKITNLFHVAFHAMMAAFVTASIQCAFVDIAADLHVSVQRTSYLSSLVIAILGVAPLVWQPLSHVYGRRPIFLISMLLSGVANVGCALSQSYASMAICRALMGVFISPAASLGSGVVTETFFKRERARYMGIWTIMLSLGVPLAPLLFGFVAVRIGYRWIYWILAMVNGVQMIVYFFFGPETRYDPSSPSPPPKSYIAGLVTFRRIDPTPLHPVDFIRPLLMINRACIVIPAVTYAMIHLWGSILGSLMIPQIFPSLFHLNTQQIGLQQIGAIVGTLLGEQIGGYMSDAWMLRRARRTSSGGHFPEPEYRLWLSYIGHGLTICGVVVFLVQVENATPGHWNVTPVVGAAISSAGNQVVTTVMITYAVDCYRPESASIGVFINFVRQTWCFTGPFWLPQMVKKGLACSTGIYGLIKAVSAIIVFIFFIDATGRGKAATAMIVLFGFLWSFGANGLPLIIASEVFPPALRSVGGNFASMIVWLWSFVVTKSLPSMFATVGYGVYIITGGILVCAAIYAYFFIPETKGLRIDQMNQLFGGVGGQTVDYEKQVHAEYVEGTVERKEIV